MKSDEVYKKTKRQIQKDYNDALEEALRKNREYFKTVEKVQNGKIKPPVRIAYRCTDRSVEAWIFAAVCQKVRRNQFYVGRISIRWY